MILDAETLAPAPGSTRCVAAAEGRRAARAAQDRAARLGGRAEHGRRAPTPRRRSRPSSRCAPAAAEAAAERARDRGGGHAPLRPSEAQPIVARAALPRVRRVRRHLGAAPGRQRAHVHVGMPGATVLARPRGRPPVAAGRARALGELAVPRRRRDGSVLEPCRVLAELPRARRAARVRLVRGVGGVRRAVRARSALADDYTRFWWDVRPHPRFGTLEMRVPDQPTARRADRRVRGAAAGALRDRARVRRRRARPSAATTRRTAGRRRASARAPS